MAMAAATPEILPVPMVAARAVHRLWNWLMERSSLAVWAVMCLLVKIPPMVFFIQYPNLDSWKARVRMVIRMPVPTSIISMGIPQTNPLTALLTVVTV